MREKEKRKKKKEKRKKSIGFFFYLKIYSLIKMTERYWSKGGINVEGEHITTKRI